MGGVEKGVEGRKGWKGERGGELGIFDFRLVLNATVRGKISQEHRALWLLWKMQK